MTNDFTERIPMPYLFNILYAAAILLLSPWLLYKALTTGKYRRGLWTKLTGRAVQRTGNTPCAWFHGVSVGEIHLLQHVVAAFRRRHPDWQCVVSTTTDTGLAEAQKRFGELPVFYWPLDFTWAVRRALQRVRPSLVVLAEGELWPNFLTIAQRLGIPVAVINGRMSPRSLRRYELLGGLARRLLNRLALCAAQTDEYAQNYCMLGADLDIVHVTGNVKFDGACTDRANPRTRQLGELLAVQPGDLIWIAGSTQAPEEQFAIDIYRRARAEHPNLRLILVPRQQDRFEEVVHLLERSGLGFVRRSTLAAPLAARDAVVLMDTIGELGALWGLADVAFVGGSMDGRRGGQNMIEPAAYGAAVVFGPHVWNFKEIAIQLVVQNAAVQVRDADALEREVCRLLADSAARAALGEAARRFVQAQQGATERTVQLLGRLLQSNERRELAA
jgi:3-deoxy-D-manno-octulosonic-acid transferase